jgi:hypothetical protein
VLGLMMLLPHFSIASGGRAGIDRAAPLSSTPPQAA